MAFQKAIFISFGLGTTLALSACGPKDDKPTGMGGAAGLGGGGGVVVGAGGTPGLGGVPAGGTVGAGGTAPAAGGAAGGAPSADCTTIDYSTYAAMPAVSFQKDLLPMFGQSCVQSDCHGIADHKAGLNLGHKCDYDANNLPWKCTFPAAPTDPNDSTKSAPDDAATQMAIYQSLIAPSMTAPTMQRVKPMDPANSFIILKMSGTQNSKGLACTNQDTSRDMTPCGGSMPLTGTMYCQGSTRPRFDAIAAWIAQGAMMN
ncbi:MAG TPA: hypothetical protein VH062_29945 [Polyangiaceae bacterium]|jgi:hypothetical protein|nr:hypothetical protein [Polyangiaceae bacterium]